MQPIKSAQELMHDVASDVDDATDSDIPPTEYTNATTCNQITHGNENDNDSRVPD